MKLFPRVTSQLWVRPGSGEEGHFMGAKVIYPMRDGVKKRLPHGQPLGRTAISRDTDRSDVGGKGIHTLSPKCLDILPPKGWKPLLEDVLPGIM